MYGYAGVKVALRDTQMDEPSCYCQRCSGEVYDGETTYLWDGSKICRDCFRDAVKAWLGEAVEEVAFALGIEMEEA